MSRKPNAYNQIVHILHELHKQYPSYNMGRHLSTALDGWGDLWGVKDSEILFALTKYKAQLDSDGYFHDENIDKIIDDGMHLDDILRREDEEDNYD